MFDAESLSLAAVAALQHRFNDVARQLYFMPPDADPVAPLIDSPLKQRIALLCAVANGDSQHEGEVAEAHMAVAEAMAWMPSRYRPAALEQLLVHVRLWLDRDELITLSHAARILRGEANDTALRYVNYLVKAGKLTRYTDPNEPNPQRAGRVSRHEVEQLR